MSEWIPVSERLPEPETDVLCFRTGVWLANPPVVAGLFDDGKWFTFDVPDKALKGVTHWMPLPEPPKEQSCMTSGKQS